MSNSIQSAQNPLKVEYGLSHVYIYWIQLLHYKYIFKDNLENLIFDFEQNSV